MDLGEVFGDFKAVGAVYGREYTRIGGGTFRNKFIPMECVRCGYKKDLRLNSIKINKGRLCACNPKMQEQRLAAIKKARAVVRQPEKAEIENWFVSLQAQVAMAAEKRRILSKTWKVV